MAKMLVEQTIQIQAKLPMENLMWRKGRDFGKDGIRDPSVGKNRVLQWKKIQEYNKNFVVLIGM